MKNLILLCITLILIDTSNLFSQIGINEYGSPPDPSAMFDIFSTTRGFLPPRLTNSQRDAIPSPAAGLLIYNSEENEYQFFNGTSWHTITYDAGIPTPPASITGKTNPICEEANVTYSVQPVISATYYNWQVPSGSIITSGQGTTDIIVDFGTQSGTVSVRTENSGGNSGYTNLDVIVGFLPTPDSIYGEACSDIDETNVIYYLYTISDATYYNWLVPNDATITNGQGSTAITVDFGVQSGNVRVRAENNCGFSSYKTRPISVGLPAHPKSITGSSNVYCNQTGVSYRVDSTAGALFFDWTVPSGATIQSGQGTPSIVVNFGITAGIISVRAGNNCGFSEYTELAINFFIDPPDNIIGNGEPIINSTDNIYSITPVDGATNYHWTFPPDAIITSGQGMTSISVNFGAINGNISVRAESDCGNSEYINLPIVLEECNTAFTDLRDGHIYNKILINNQCWMQENLNVGTKIDISQNQTDNGTIEKYCYNNIEDSCDVYGGLYQWNETMQYVTTESVQGICPNRWHIPTYGEWTILANYLGGDDIAGGKMKDVGYSHWLPPNAGATNESGFTAYGAGDRNITPIAETVDLGILGAFWSSLQNDDATSFIRLAYSEHDHLPFNAANKEYGVSVRCIKNN